MFEVRVKCRLFARSRRVSVGTYDIFALVRQMHVVVEVLNNVETCQQLPATANSTLIMAYIVLYVASAAPRVDTPHPSPTFMSR